MRGSHVAVAAVLACGPALASCDASPTPEARQQPGPARPPGVYELTFTQTYPGLQNDSGVGKKLRDRAFPAAGLVRQVFEVGADSQVSGLAAEVTDASGTVFTTTSWSGGGEFVIREWRRCEVGADSPPEGLSDVDLIAESVGPRSPAGGRSDIPAAGRTWSVNDGIVDLRVTEPAGAAWPTRTIEATREDGKVAYAIDGVALRPSETTVEEVVARHTDAFTRACPGAVAPDADPPRVVLRRP